jgi:phage terminase small subunit
MPSIDKFIAGMIEHGEKRRAAIEAGYSAKTAHVQATALLKRPKVVAALADSAQRLTQKAELSAERVLEELRRIATFDYRQFYDAEGNFKPPTEWTEEMGAVVSSSETVIKNVTAGDRKQDTVTKIRLNPKTDALNTLAKYFGLLSERVEHHGKLEIVWKDTEE